MRIKVKPSRTILTATDVELDELSQEELINSELLHGQTTQCYIINNTQKVRRLARECSRFQRQNEQTKKDKMLDVIHDVYGMKRQN